MNIWLVTTGSSDVQLISNEDWNDWWQAIKQSVYRIRFNPSRAIDDDGEPYRLPARVLGIAYDQLPDRVKPHLSFPLLQNFTQELKLKAVEIDQIIVLMSDQENLFPESERETTRCPYWQDTCQLYPVLTDYFCAQFPDAVVTPLILKPSERGLDDWDAVLELVQQEVESLHFEAEPQTVYVSHQAGTPAISSAVQFSSLARFGDRVKFLVSSEQATQLSKILPSSSYLKGIRKQEAEALLGSHNYSGVKALVKDYLKGREETDTLLSAATQWNVAKFDEFLEGLTDYSKFSSEVADCKKAENWWWIAYEEVYLALIRKEQGNIVEAFFHSFRAFEGIFASWGKQYFDEHIEFIGGVPHLNPSALDDTRDYFSSRKCNDVSDLKKIKEKLEALKAKPPEEKIKTDERVKLDMQTLCKFFRSSRYKEYKKDCGELEIFWDTKNNKENNVSEKRNNIVHQIRGMSEVDLWNFWDVTSQKEWEGRLLTFLNFIIKGDFPEGFKTLEEASLMFKVHQELEKAIAQL